MTAPTTTTAAALNQQATRHYIDGAFVASDGGALGDVINPATEEPVARVVLGTTADVDRAVAAARRAFTTFSQTSREERLALLHAIVAAYKARIPDLARAMSEEMGAPMSFAMMAQAPAGLAGFLSTIPALEGFQFTEESNGAVIAHEPIGVVGMITPWNWPLNQIALKVAPAIAAGNTMVLKPSEECPTSAAIFAEVMDAAGVPAGVFNLVHGDGPTVGNAIAAHRDIDMVSFTGSTRAGILVAKAAADTVKRVHQELGGKAPNLVLPGADLAAVLPPTLQGVLANTGQSCIAPTRLLVHRDQADAAAAGVKAILEGATAGDPMVEGAHLGPVVNKAQHDKIQGLIETTMAEGASLATGGPGLPEGVNRGYYIRPTLFTNVTPDMTIWREETFGPVATITTYDDLDQAIELANDTVYGLSATISGDVEAARAVAPRLRAGIVTINRWGPGNGAPFGGYKQSGNGREGGVHGLRDFMEVKAIVA